MLNSGKNRTLGTGYLSVRNTEKVNNITEFRSLRTKHNRFKNEFFKKQKQIIGLGMSPRNFQSNKAEN